MAKISSGWLMIVLLAAAVIGIADATYLTLIHWLEAEAICLGPTGCDIVLASSYATVGPIPIAAIGLLFYIGLAWLLINYWHYARAWVLGVILGLTGTAVLVSLWLVYVQLVILTAICSYCLISAAVNLILFLGAVALAGQRWLGWQFN